MIKGFDTSHHQKVELFEWDKLKAHGYQFMIARASYGARTADRSFVDFAQHIRDNGLTFGAYHFYRQIHTVEDQLAIFDRQLELVGGLSVGDLYPTLDMEENSANDDGRPKSKHFSESCRRIAESWRDEYGGCILYYSSYFPEYLKPLDNYSWMRAPGFYHWLADYNREPGNPRTPYTNTWNIHQPKPPKTAFYANGSTVVDTNVINEATDFNSLLIPGTDQLPSDDAVEGEIDTNERPGGALHEELDDAVGLIRDGIECILKGLEVLSNR